MTALGVLLASGKNVVTAERWGGVYVDKIDGLQSAGGTKGWMYQVNGVSPGAMANNYNVKYGDKVIWYYVDDMQTTVTNSKKVYAFTVSTSASVSGIAGGSTTQPYQPGVQITIPLADVIWNGDTATATIRGMIAEIVPAAAAIPSGGTAL